MATGWFPLNRAPYSAINAYSVNNSYLGTASGQSSVVIGGFGIVASGLWSACIGGSSNTASATWSGVYGGQSNTASGNNAVVVGGDANTASGIRSFVCGGQNNNADSTSSVVVGGRRGTVRGIVGNFVAPASDAPVASAAGVTQSALLLLGRETTDATATRLTSNTSAASTTNQVILPNNSAYFFQGQVVAGVTGAGNTKGWTVEGVIKRGANAASTVLVGSTVMSSYGDAGAVTWVVALTADTTNGGLAVTVTGQAATTIRWVAQIRTTEMTF